MKPVKAAMKPFVKVDFPENKLTLPNKPPTHEAHHY